MQEILYLGTNITYKRICLGLLLLVAVFTGYSQDKKTKLQQTKKQIEKEIAYTTKLLADTRKNKQASLNQINILKSQIQKREELIRNINEELETLDSEITNHQLEIDHLNIQLKNLKVEYAKMIYSAYKNRNSYQKLMFVFAAKDFNQAYQRLKYFQQYAVYRKKQAELIQSTQKQINLNIVSLQEKKQDKEVLVHRQVNEKSKLTLEQDEQTATIKKLKKKEKELYNTLKEKEESSKKIQKAIENIIAEEIKKAAALAAQKRNTDKKQNKIKPNENGTKKEAPAPNKIELTPAETELDNSFTNNKGKLPWPTEKGFISSTFGEHQHPVLHGITTRNNGVDILTERGSTARAVFNGVVTGIISLPNSQKAIIVRHGSYLSVYANLENVHVKTGEKVKTRQVIGTIHTDASESKTELHFEIRNNKIILNPSLWLSSKK